MKKNIIKVLDWLDEVASPFIYSAIAVYEIYKGDIKLAGCFCFLVALFFVNKKLKS